MSIRGKHDPDKGMGRQCIRHSLQLVFRYGRRTRYGEHPLRRRESQMIVFRTPLSSFRSFSGIEKGNRRNERFPLT